MTSKIYSYFSVGILNLFLMNKTEFDQNNLTICVKIFGTVLENFFCLVANVADCDILVRDITFSRDITFTFELIALGKGWNLFTLQF